MTPYELILSISKFPFYTVYTVIRCIYGHIRHIYGIRKSHIRFGPTLDIREKEKSVAPYLLQVSTRFLLSGLRANYFDFDKI